MLKFLAVFLAITLSACGYKPQPFISNRNCPLPRGLPAGNLLLFGEMHGSVESPKLISDIACSLSATEDVAVGLEISSIDQPLIDKYIQSHGTSTDVAALTSSDFWQNGKDGRSSKAMLQLIEDIRVLKQEGRTIDLFAFDDQPYTTLERNVAIANGIRRFHDAHNNTRIVALMGSIHAMQEVITIGAGPLVPSGKILSDLNPVSILITYPAGTTWACMPACGVQSITPRSQTIEPPGFKNGAPIGGYDYSFLLPSITASPPATQQGT